jgi:hypothetical protein
MTGVAGNGFLINTRKVIDYPSIRCRLELNVASPDSIENFRFGDH